MGERFIFYLLREQYNMTEIIINGTDDKDKNEQENEDKDKKKRKRKNKSQIEENKIAKSRVYFSPKFGEKETLLLLVPGPGAVRAGQWARSICINDNLAAGCMYPFIADAYSKNWGVVLFDPNGRTEKGMIFSDEHVLHVYDKYIEEAFLSKKDCKIKNVLIVCHSAGGIATTHLLNDRTEHLLPRIRAVAGTDTFFGKAKNKKIQNVYKQRIVNWVTSSEPLGTILSESVPKRVSAGHSAHEYTSASAFKQIMNYFDAMLKMNKMMNIDDKSLEKNKNEKKKDNEKSEKKEDKEPQCDDKEKNDDQPKDKNDDVETNDDKQNEKNPKDVSAKSDKMEVDED